MLVAERVAVPVPSLVSVPVVVPMTLAMLRLPAPPRVRPKVAPLMALVVGALGVGATYWRVRRVRV